MKLLLMMFVCTASTWIALEEGGGGSAYAWCDRSPATGLCSSYAKCRFLDTATRCSVCVDESTPGYRGWDFQSGANQCGCITKDKVERPGSWTSQTCESFGGRWHMGKCWFLEHTGLTTQAACEANGGEWDVNQLKCCFGDCRWAWI